MGLIDQTDYQYYNGDNLGGYQFTSLQNIIDQFVIAYVGEEKIISKIRKPEVVFHAQRAMQEFSFDTFKSVKSQEITVPNTLTMSLPKDYVNYVKISWVDNSGIHHPLYPNRDSSNPKAIEQNTDSSYDWDDDEDTTEESSGASLSYKDQSASWARYKSNTPPENQNEAFEYDEENIYSYNEGRRYGIDTERAQTNGTYFIDDSTGKMYFSSNIAGLKVVLEYISDGLGTDDEMKVHKFAEEAMYKCIAYAVLSTRANTPEVIVQRFRREAFAAKRTAKLRLSNVKLNEIVQVMRGKSKQIKH
tara:strand:+ start:1022 stop:1930 length:909 start_codon:yes stop_codon:yes gene_type:complete